MVGVFVARGPAGGGWPGPGPGQGGVFRQTEMEAALAGDWSPDAIAAIVTPADGLDADIDGSADTGHTSGVMARRAVAKACERPLAAGFAGSEAGGGF